MSWWRVAQRPVWTALRWPHLAGQLRPFTMASPVLVSLCSVALRNVTTIMHKAPFRALRASRGPFSRQMRSCYMRID